MIVRIGDERRSMLEEHLRKLRDTLLSEDTLKYHRHLVINSIVQAVTNLPHKCFVYGALIGIMTQTQNGLNLATEVLALVIESLQRSLVQERNVPASKNLIRYMAVCVEFGTLSSGCFSQLLI
jgi:hypothetical protein